MEDKTYFAQGRYRGQVTRQALGKAKTGNPQFVLSFELHGRVDPNDPDNLEPCDTYERSIFMTITDKTIDFILDDLERLGFVGDSFAALDPDRPASHDFTGTVVDVFCEHSTYEGVAREKWRLHREGGSRLEVEPLQDVEVRKLDAMFGKALKAKVASRPAVPVAEPPDPAPVPASEEIPF